MARRSHGTVVHTDDIAARHWLWSGLQALPPRQRDVLVLRYYEARTETEAADILGCSVPAIKRRTNHGLRRLSSHLGPDAVLIMQRVAR
ncbi:sigma factor-like helix-turn-helix DNA-binding protein [Kribbella flavida]|uniref:sigma factor-like helix-turn-helix DNA-binding protein n=1 Tax=Kribbella flavida TaxID=182640 RepID=UPI00019BE886|nr:sigma factor-like helix-turn-helix DNA-binding protein [Kribbella flavida]